jgi:O-acetyl-ADP-ribose deacetylase (regulator of RNase III)
VHRLEIAQRDITTLDVDAIVNAANTSLLGGGGVDGAIHRAAGPDLLAECRGLGGCATGSAKITRGHRLRARHVIHAVGPVYDSARPGTSEELLAACYRASLALAANHGLRSIAFHCISTGVYGYPRRAAAHVAVRTIVQFFAANTLPETVILSTFDEAATRAVEEALAAHFHPSSPK